MYNIQGMDYDYLVVLPGRNFLFDKSRQISEQSCVKYFNLKLKRYIFIRLLKNFPWITPENMSVSYKVFVKFHEMRTSAFIWCTLCTLKRQRI